MTETSSSHSDHHRFYAHTRSEDRHHAHLVPQAKSFLDAALTFAEHWHSPAAEEPLQALAVIVRDGHTGEEQCFTVDLDSGDAEPCA